ncbi:MAG: hypothetical protein MHM6MM_001235 [Cercozoa sp. M6MM]
MEASSQQEESQRDEDTPRAEAVVFLTRALQAEQERCAQWQHKCEKERQKSEASQREASALKQRVLLLDAQRQQLQEANASLHTRNKTLQTQLAARTSLDEALRQLIPTGEVRQALEDELETSRNLLSEERARTTRLSSELAAARLAADAAQTALEEMQHSLRQEQQQRRTLEEALQKRHLQLDAANESLRVSQEQHDVLTRRQESNEELLTQMRESLRAQEEEVRRADEIRGRIAAQEADLARLRAIVRTSRRTVAFLMQNISPTAAATSVVPGDTESLLGQVSSNEDTVLSQHFVQHLLAASDASDAEAHVLLQRLLDADATQWRRMVFALLQAAKLEQLQVYEESPLRVRAKWQGQSVLVTCIQRQGRSVSVEEVRRAASLAAQLDATCVVVATSQFDSAAHEQSATLVGRDTTLLPLLRAVAPTVRLAVAPATPPVPEVDTSSECTTPNNNENNNNESTHSENNHNNDNSNIENNNNNSDKATSPPTLGATPTNASVQQALALADAVQPLELSSFAREFVARLTRATPSQFTEAVRILLEAVSLSPSPTPYGTAAASPTDNESFQLDTSMEGTPIRSAKSEYARAHIVEWHLQESPSQPVQAVVHAYQLRQGQLGRTEAHQLWRRMRQCRAAQCVLLATVPAAQRLLRHVRNRDVPGLVLLDEPRLLRLVHALQHHSRVLRASHVLHVAPPSPRPDARPNSRAQPRPLDDKENDADGDRTLNLGDHEHAGVTAHDFVDATQNMSWSPRRAASATEAAMRDTTHVLASVTQRFNRMSHTPRTDPRGKQRFRTAPDAPGTVATGTSASRHNHTAHSTLLPQQLHF